MSTNLAQLAEIFNSIQGEGLYVGVRQIFIRFAGCNLTCQYCDSPQALEIPAEFKVEAMPGQKNYQKFKNPAAAAQVVDLVKSLDKPKGTTHSLSLTGGEPLLQVEFLKEFLPLLKAELKLPLYLETNGVLPDHLAEVIDLLDIIALDIKLPSATGLSPYWKEHKKALEVAFLKEVFVKITFTRESRPKELDEAVSLIAGVSEKIPLVLQPSTPFGAIKHRPQAEQILAFQAIAKRKLADVRVIPQTHKIMGVL